MKHLLLLALLALSACHKGSPSGNDFSEVASKTLDSFRSEDRNFVIDFRGTYTAFGTNHGEVPD